MIKVFYICSYGGSGSHMLESWLKNYGLVYHMHDPNPPDVLTHPKRNPVMTQTPDLNSWGGKELNLDKYKPYVIYTYARPECSVWSRCAPTHWLNLQTPHIVVARLCALMDIPFCIVKPNRSRAIDGILDRSEWFRLHPYTLSKKGTQELQAEIEANTYLSETMGVKDFLTQCLVDVKLDNGRYSSEWNIGFLYGNEAVNSTELSKKYFNFPMDYINYERFFRNYTYKKKSYDVLCVNYHYIWENLEFLFNFCEIPLEDIDKFPKQRTPSWEKDPQVALELEKAHDGIFKSLNDLIKQKPPIGVLHKHEKKG